MSDKVAATWHPGTAPDSTPIDRAAEAIRAVPLGSAGRRTYRVRLARAALSAALTNDADPDFGARNLYETEHAAWLRDPEEAPRWQWDTLSESERGVYRKRYANLVAAILGESA